MPGELDPRSVLGKVMIVLGAFAHDDGGLTLAELGRRTGLPKGTLHRVAADLVTARLLDRSGHRYRLSTRLFELGMRASVERSLIDIATPFMEDLYELTHETVNLGVREGSEVMYVSKIGGHQQTGTPARVGGRMPLHSTAIGKVLLAHASRQFRAEYLHGHLQRHSPRTLIAPGILDRHLQAVVERGVAFEFEESQIGIVCVGAPIAFPDQGVLAAISVTGPVRRFNATKYSSRVRAAAAGISATMARRQALFQHHA
ncbi:MAG: IclR family transcriptional regulator [Aeromicrobium sp.]|jgi:DNA-binding IclR family transcriptional regulator|nr:IclR family transcriptional regulator [Aeromicrobium sp.]